MLKVCLKNMEKCCDPNADICMSLLQATLLFNQAVRGILPGLSRAQVLYDYVE